MIGDLITNDFYKLFQLLIQRIFIDYSSHIQHISSANLPQIQFQFSKIYLIICLRIRARSGSRALNCSTEGCYSARLRLREKSQDIIRSYC